ncbi:DUF1656 domain-containing protein [Methylobacterium aerolatum]|uniref:DUF1656 domain-containing protein n=1 Tax=Methylobacterium aerolatum TaxID=418708 RepID=A0ABU0I4T8_9HYPH|nr:DUF1656 domain-containing protein [Methylobacterium aerolatum]MDQ0449633.1 hypothetical protein [Methylobacterium aerolatum]GJD36079.1 Protein AaeX [Methylobacterium aerolatum]
MTGEFDIGGVFIPALGVWMLAAFLLSLAVRRVLARLGAYRAVWHRPLFDLALYVLLLGAVVSLTQSLTS